MAGFETSTEAWNWKLIPAARSGVWQSVRTIEAAMAPACEIGP